MRQIKPYNFCMKPFFLKWVFFEILRGFHTFGKPCIDVVALRFRRVRNSHAEGFAEIVEILVNKAM